jgi:predicted GNAT family N-acyltransferase
MPGSGSGCEWISHCFQPGDALKKWDCTKRYDAQADDLPQIFKDAMAVREAVYVDEQGVPLAVELDEDDPRSFHFVQYISVAQRHARSFTPPGETLEQEFRRRSTPSAVRTPAATIRLIPPPHAPNPYKKKHPDGATEEHHVTEPYIKLGRLSTLRAFRGLGMSHQLIREALDFASANPDQILPAKPYSTRTGSIKEKEEAKGWQGLAMVHAQASVKGLWEKHGFSECLLRADGSVEVPEEEHWDEEGIEHMAMWRRIPLTSDRKPARKVPKELTEYERKEQQFWENL